MKLAPKYVYACDCGWSVRLPILAHVVCPKCKTRLSERDLALEPPDPPGLIRRAVNYAKAEVRHTAAGRPEATDKQIAERFAICQSNRCGFFIDKGEGLGQCAHSSCGCSLKRLSQRGERSKLRWADQQCPSVNPETNQPWWDKIDEVGLRHNDDSGQSGQPPAGNNLLSRIGRFFRSLVIH